MVTSSEDVVTVSLAGWRWYDSGGCGESVAFEYLKAALAFSGGVVCDVAGQRKRQRRDIFGGQRQIMIWQRQPDGSQRVAAWKDVAAPQCWQQRGVNGGSSRGVVAAAAAIWRGRRR